MGTEVAGRSRALWLRTTSAKPQPLAAQHSLCRRAGKGSSSPEGSDVLRLHRKVLETVLGWLEGWELNKHSGFSTRVSPPLGETARLRALPLAHQEHERDFLASSASRVCQVGPRGGGGGLAVGSSCSRLHCASGPSLSPDCSRIRSGMTLCPSDGRSFASHFALCPL